MRGEGMTLQEKFFIENTLFEGSLVKAYYHTYQTFGNLDIHAHDFYELNIVLKGDGVHYVDKNKYTTITNSVFMIPPQVKHGYRFYDKNYSVFHLLLHNQFISKYKHVLKHLKGYNILFHIEPKLRLENKGPAYLTLAGAQKKAMEEYIKNLLHLNESTNINKETMKETTALSILAYLCGNISEGDGLSEETDFFTHKVLNAMDYIQSNYYEKIVVDDLIKKSRLSRSTFMRTFRYVSNMTPLEYLNKVRVEKAKKLLIETEHTITFIALECGFYDSSHFSRIFKKHENLLPSEYKKSKNE